MAKKSSSVFSKIWRIAKRVFIILFISSFLYILLCKWVMPLTTVTQLSAWISGDGLKRDYVPWDEISANVKLAAIASEDQLFVSHGGFDWAALQKSLQAQPENSTRLAGTGASTISQQTAKNVFLWQREGVMKYVRKVPEVYFTKMIEWIWGKKRIMEVYLNVIEMGKGVYGIEAAAQFYFHKPAKSLSRAESATIIACLPNPKLYTVKPLSKFVAWKTQWILKQMKNLQDEKGIQDLIK